MKNWDIELYLKIFIVKLYIEICENEEKDLYIF